MGALLFFFLHSFLRSPFCLPLLLLCVQHVPVAAPVCAHAHVCVSVCVAVNGNLWHCIVNEIKYMAFECGHE